MLDLPILKYDHFSCGWAAPALPQALDVCPHGPSLVCSPPSSTLYKRDHWVSCEPSLCCKITFSEVSELPLCCAMTFTEVSNRGFSQDQFLLWVWVKIIEKEAFLSTEADFMPGHLPFEGNLSHPEQGCISQPFYFDPGTISPSHIMGPKWPVKCLLIARRFRKEKNRPVQQGSPGALLLRRARWRNNNAKRALLTEHQITGITF